MDLKILMVILIYYGFLSVVFTMGGAYLTGYSGTDANITASGVDPSEVDQGGLFGTGINFGRFAGLITIGIGLPDDTPSWFSTIFMVWQTAFLIFTIGWFIASIWNG